MILLIGGVVLICVLPLSIIVLYRNQNLMTLKTFEVCRNLAHNISNLATEELLIDETYDATRTALSRLKENEISSLTDVYVVNVDGYYVAEYENHGRVGKKAPEYELKYIKGLHSMDLIESKNSSGRNVLKFTYPIFITQRNENMRVGAAVFEFDKEEVYLPVNQIRATIFAVGGILFIIGIGIAFYSAVEFSKPIRKLAEGAKLIGSGNLNHRIELTGKDELGQLANRFNQMTERIQDFTQNLEHMVEQRTDELNRTLKEVQALKIAQDGDYYLTSLLLEPLQPNNNRSQNVHTDFLIDQKKKFKFRNWEAQIGGDICITDSLFLRNKEYTVFINGDAMGKSIQGAGGALVFGAVFNAGLIRSKLARNPNSYPETWLKERFLDLQNVFLSFDGSMYISVCMGLIENETGVMYYINAEHPFSVLYRDGKASFLENELALRKLGMPGQEDHFSVRIFQLMQGDLVFVGSDGRDDILVKNLEGEETVQEDETLFLKTVEKAEGQIETVREITRKQGVLIDDLSLLRIQFDGPQKTIAVPYSSDLEDSIRRGYRLLEKGKTDEVIAIIDNYMSKFKDLPSLLHLSGVAFLAKKDYERAIACFEELVTLDPTNGDAIFQLSKSHAALGDWDKAADAAERLFLREPHNLKNLKNLAEIYLESGILPRADFMIKKAVEIYPDDKEALVLYKKIKEAWESEIDSKAKTEISESEMRSVILRADQHYSNKEYRKAIQEYLKALGMDDDHAWVLFRLANCYYFTQKTEECIRYFNRSIAVSPKNYHARNNLGSVYFHLGDYDKAREQWMRALQIKPDFKTAQKNLDKLNDIMDQGVLS
ncbi:tetratricopeptide repeat protein [Leptospira perolatii]|nr:tetratricopeptide repeat protein [Leptospira perolatii]